MRVFFHRDSDEEAMYDDYFCKLDGPITIPIIEFLEKNFKSVDFKVGLYPYEYFKFNDPADDGYFILLSSNGLEI